MINTFKIKLFYLTMSGLLGTPLIAGRLTNQKSSLKDFNNEFSTEHSCTSTYLENLKQADSYEPAV